MPPGSICSGLGYQCTQRLLIACQARNLPKASRKRQSKQLKPTGGHQSRRLAAFQTKTSQKRSKERQVKLDFQHPSEELADLRNPQPLPGYRKNVGICLLNSIGRVFAARRCSDTDGYWQMPQGGIDGKESIEEAASRELREETGIIEARIVKIVDDWLSYTFHFAPGFQPPKHLLQFKGQSQKWVLMRIDREDCEVDLEAHYPQEFQEYKWMQFDDFLSVAQPFKKHIYQCLSEELASELA